MVLSNAHGGTAAVPCLVQLLLLCPPRQWLPKRTSTSLQTTHHYLAPLQVLGLSCPIHRYFSVNQWLSCGTCAISASPCSSPVLPQAPTIGEVFISATTLIQDATKSSLGLGCQHRSAEGLSPAGPLCCILHLRKLLPQLLWSFLTRRWHVLAIGSRWWALWGQAKQHNLWRSGFLSWIFLSFNCYILSPSLETQLLTQLSSAGWKFL